MYWIFSIQGIFDLSRLLSAGKRSSTLLGISGYLQQRLQAESSRNSIHKRSQDISPISSLEVNDRRSNLLDALTSSENLPTYEATNLARNDGYSRSLLDSVTSNNIPVANFLDNSVNVGYPSLVPSSSSSLSSSSSSLVQATNDIASMLERDSEEMVELLNDLDDIQRFIDESNDDDNDNDDKIRFSSNDINRFNNNDGYENGDNFSDNDVAYSSLMNDDDSEATRDDDDVRMIYNYEPSGLSQRSRRRFHPRFIRW